MTRIDAFKGLLAKVEAGDDNPGRRYGWWSGTLSWREWSLVCVIMEDNSLNAAKALHDAVLPGWVWRPEIGTDGPYEGYMSPPISPKGFNTSAPSPARAWLIAILKALIAQENEQGVNGECGSARGTDPLAPDMETG